MSTIWSSTERHQHCVQRRKAARECIRCGDKLPEGHTKFCCPDCLEHVNEYNRVYRAPKPSRYRETIQEESPRWHQLDASEHCPRCGLRGEHECLPSIDAIASSRRGAGRVYPTGGP